MFNKYLTLFLLVTSFLLTLLLVISCDDNPSKPEDPPPPGSRNYTWTAETLKVGGSGLILKRLDGSSENDIWAGGSGNFQNQLWHYDGNNWSTDSVYRALLELGGMKVFSSDNVWVSSGNDGSIWHYNGLFWTRNHEVNYEGYNSIVFNQLWGRTPDNIYTSGFAQNTFTRESFGIIVHYDGEKWTKLDIPKVDNISYNQIIYDKKENIYIVTAIEFIDNILHDKLLLFDGEKLEEIYSEINSNPEIYVVDDETYIKIGTHKAIYTLSGKELIKKYDFKNTPYFRFMNGRSVNDFFTWNFDGLGHYNGNNLQTLYKTDENNIVRAITTFEKSVFAIISTPKMDFIMLRGDLIE